jgi:hypothetical protein
MKKPKYIRFSKFSSQRANTSKDEAQRLIKLKKEVKRLKRQRLIIMSGVCLVTGTVVYLIAK